MSSTIPRKAALVLYECNSEYVTIMQRDATTSYEAVGKWLIASLRQAADYCVINGITRPDIHVVPTMVPQAELDQIEVEELLVHAKLQREADGAE